MRITVLSVFILLSGPVFSDDLSVNAKVERAMFGAHRAATQVERNQYRHPVGTLEFFGLSDEMRVLEIWPGSGWYTEILAPVLRDSGAFVVASWDPEVRGQPDYRYRLPKEMLEKFAANPEVYDQVEVVHYSPPQSASLGAENSYDMVLTFRNTHGWINDNLASAIYAEFARVVKPGGVLGVVQHRAQTGSDPLESAKTGYVSEEAVIAIVEAAGFVFEASSEVNANPKDTKDHPEGVWTLPPSFDLEDVDREKYAAIGESDRMTLRFRKPE